MVYCSVSIKQGHTITSPSTLLADQEKDKSVYLHLNVQIFALLHVSTQKDIALDQHQSIK
jgi:hypothetical protein